MFLIDRTHESRRWGKNFVDEDEDGLLGRELDALADNIDELAHSQVLSTYVLFSEPPKRSMQTAAYRRYEVLLLVNRWDVRLVCLLADDLRIPRRAATIRPTLSNLFGVQRATHVRVSCLGTSA